MQTLQIFAYDTNGTRWELDLYEEDPLKLTISSEDIIDIPRIDASFSRQFRIPATQTNSKFFKYWYISGVVDFDVTVKVIAEIYVNGILFKSGQLRMEAVYDNSETGQIDFEIIFLGETKDFATQVGEGFLTNLDTYDANHTLTLTNLQNSWRALGDPDLFLDGKVRYIIAQRGNTWNSENAPIEPSEIDLEADNWNNGGPDANQQAGTFTVADHPLPIDMFTPIIQVKYLIDKIFERTSYTYSADSIFNETWFQDLYTDGVPESSPRTTVTSGTMESETTYAVQIGTGYPATVKFNNEISDPTNSYNPFIGVYTTPKAGSYSFTASIKAFDNYFQYPYGGFIAKLWHGTTVVDTATASAQNFGPFQPTLLLSATFTAAFGEQIRVTLEATGGAEQPGYLAGSTFKCTAAPASVVINQLLKDDVKSLDFFRSILTKFRLVMVPSKSDPYQFIIKPWQEYIGTGDLFDWTNKIDRSKDVEIKPVFFSQSAVINFTDVEDNDVVNTFHRDTYNQTYGRRLYDSENELIKDTREVKTIFAPTPVDQVLGATTASNFIVPYLASWPNGEEVTHGNHIHAKYLPLKVKPRLLFWNGAVLTNPLKTWYYTDYLGFNPTGAGATIVNTTSYPRATYISDLPSVSDTINLNWKKDISYFSNAGGPVDNLSKDVYELYWNDYIEELYSADARLMTAYFNIGADDLRELTFDDVIFIKDSYWRVQKIYDATLDEISTVKVDLVKLINWNPPACLIARPIVLGTDQTAATNPTTFDGKLFFHFLGGVPVNISTGEYSASVTGPNGYTWSGNHVQQSVKILTGLETGDYFVTITDGCGTSVTVKEIVANCEDTPQLIVGVSNPSYLNYGTTFNNGLIQGAYLFPTSRDVTATGGGAVPAGNDIYLQTQGPDGYFVSQNISDGDVVTINGLLGGNYATTAQTDCRTTVETYKVGDLDVTVRYPSVKYGGYTDSADGSITVNLNTSSSTWSSSISKWNGTSYVLLQEFTNIPNNQSVILDNLTNDSTSGYTWYSITAQDAVSGQAWQTPLWTYATWSNTTNQTGFLPTGKTAPGSTTIPHPDLLNGPNNIVPTEFSYIGFDNIYNELDNAYFLRDIGPDIEVPAPTQCRVVLNINSGTYTGDINNIRAIIFDENTSMALNPGISLSGSGGNINSMGTSRSFSVFGGATPNVRVGFYSTDGTSVITNLTNAVVRVQYTQ